MVAQCCPQGSCSGDVDLCQLGGGHLPLGTLAQVHRTQGKRQSPEAAAVGQFTWKNRGRVSLHHFLLGYYGHGQVNGLGSMFTCELELAEAVVDQSCIPGTSLRLLPFMSSTNLAHKPSQGGGPMETVANHVPGKRAG